MSLEEELPFQASGTGLLLSLKVQPGAKENKIQEIRSGYLRLRVNAVADKRKANKAVIQLLAKWLGLAKSEVLIKSGETNRLKKVLLPEQIEAKLTEKLLELIRNKTNKGK
jgi:uncharacterized protein (TIGR00251 family)